MSTVAPKTRYLTAVGKRDALEFWEQRKLDIRPDGFIGGRGYADPEMFPWCDALNAIEGVCTLQSCAGHKHPDGHQWHGQLWLWLDGALARQFDVRVFELAGHPLMERVRRLYLRDGNEVVDLEYAGTDQLDASMAVIVAFFRSLRGATSAAVGTTNTASGGGWTACPQTWW